MAVKHGLFLGRKTNQFCGNHLLIAMSIKYANTHIISLTFTSVPLNMLKVRTGPVGDSRLMCNDRREKNDERCSLNHRLILSEDLLVCWSGVFLCRDDTADDSNGGPLRFYSSRRSKTIIKDPSPELLTGKLYTHAIKSNDGLV